MREATHSEKKRHFNSYSGRSYFGQCELDVVYTVSYDDDHGYTSSELAITGVHSHAKYRRTKTPNVKAKCRTLKPGPEWKITVEFFEAQVESREVSEDAT